MRPSDVILAVTPPLMWGVAFVLAKPATAHFPPIFMMAMAYGVCAVPMIPTLRGLKTPAWAVLAVGALGGAVQSSLLFLGLRDLPASTTVVVLQSQVPMAVVLAALIGDERLSLRRLVGIAVAIGGIVVIAGEPEAVGSWFAFALVILGSLSWAVAQALIRVVGRDRGSVTTASIALVSSPLCLLGSLVLESGQLRSIGDAGILAWASLASLVLFGLSIPYFIWYGLLRRFRVDQVMPFVLLMPVAGVAAGAAILGEPLAPSLLLGGALVVAGLALVLLTPAAKEPARA
jgi:O-acetylserine/cysteine efflux transporter